MTSGSAIAHGEARGGQRFRRPVWHQLRGVHVSNLTIRASAFTVSPNASNAATLSSPRAAPQPRRPRLRQQRAPARRASAVGPERVRERASQRRGDPAKHGAVAYFLNLARRRDADAGDVRPVASNILNVRPGGVRQRCDGAQQGYVSGGA